MVDADQVYGNALKDNRKVEELELAGVAAHSIEDTALPQPFGALGETRLLSVAEGVGKMRAAIAGRRDPDLVIAGRTSAAAVTSLDDAIARAKAYQAAGVDAIFLIGVRTREQLDAVSAAIDLPMIIGGAGPEIMDLDYLGTRGVRVCLQGHHPFKAAVRATHDALKALRDGTPPAEIENVASNDEVMTFTRDADYRRWTDDWLGGD